MIPTKQLENIQGEWMTMTELAFSELKKLNELNETTEYSVLTAKAGKTAKTPKTRKTPKAAQTAERTATEAAPAAKPAAPSVHRRAILTWIAVYPTITLIQTLLGTHVAGYPLPVRTLMVTVLVAPLVVYLVLPAVMKAHTKVVRGVAGRRISG